jgi:hypothetical protein
MLRRVLFLLLMVALFGVTGQSAAYAARGPDPMRSAHMTMSMADCMKMMDQSASEKSAKPARHKGCTPADCLNYMIACAGITAAIPDAAAPKLAFHDRRVTHLVGFAHPLRGRSPPPDIQPPIV